MIFDDNTMTELEQLVRLLEESEAINAELHEIHKELLAIRDEKLEMTRKLQAHSAAMTVDELDAVLRKLYEQQARLVELGKRNKVCDLRNKQVGLEIGWLLQKHPEWHQE